MERAMELPWSQRAALSAVVTMLAAAPASAGSSVSAAECKAMKTPGSPTCDAHLISDPRCSLTGDSGPGWFWPLQPALLLAACLGVLLKRSRQPWRGRPAEKRAVLALDLAKQAVASLLVQISTIVAAEKFHELEVDIEVDMHRTTNQCAWYSVVFVLQSSLGLLLTFALFKLAARVAPGTSGRYSSKEAGIRYGEFAKQLVLWILVTAAGRGLVLLGVWLLAEQLELLVATLATGFSCKASLLQWLATLLGPFALNTLQLCVQDQFMMDKKPPTKQLEGKAQPLLDMAGTATAEPEPEPEPGAAAGGEPGARDEDGVVVNKPKERSYVKKQAACMKCCCGSLISLAFLSMVGIVGWTVHSGQDSFDPCYTQIHLTPPEGGWINYTEPSFPNCTGAKNITDPSGEGLGQDFRSLMEHRQDLMEKRPGPDGQTAFYPKCTCCSALNASDLSMPCTRINSVTGELSCPHLGSCCARSTLHDPNEALVETCSTCKVYQPCDTQRCPARSDNVRNTQHYPMLIGVLLSFMGNCHVIYSYLFDGQLRKRMITHLLACAAFVELVYCICFLFQELSFRMPNDPCVWTNLTGEDAPNGFNVPTAKDDSDGVLTYRNCKHQVSQNSGWPTWYEVDEARRHGGDHIDGGRGSATNWCMPMSVMFQFTWTASDSYYFMITVDLLLNLIASPFGDTKKRYLFYHVWTWLCAIGLAVGLIVTGDWGTSFDSLLEDFCWNINFGVKGQNEGSDTWLGFGGKLGSVMYQSYALSLAYYVVAFFVAIFSRVKLRKLTKGQAEVREASIREGAMVTLVTAVWWLCGFGLTYHQLVLPQTKGIVDSLDMGRGAKDYESLNDRALVMMWAFVIGGKNFITFIVWRLVLWKFRGDGDGDGAPEELSTILQNELLFFTGLGVRAAVRNFSGDASGGGVMWPENGVVELEVACEKEKEENTTFFQDFSEVFGMDSGADFPPELQKQMREFTFKTYKPAKFLELRKLFGVDEEGRESLLVKAMEHYEAGNFSGGASGAFMYFSSDKRFIVKQMTKEEHDVLCPESRPGLLDKYAEYMKANPGSLLLRIVQCNRVEMYQGCSKVPLVGKCMRGRLYFMVFQNTFFAPLQETMKELRHERSRSSGRLSQSLEPEPEPEPEPESELTPEEEARLRKPASKRLKTEMLQYDLKGSWVNRTTVRGGPIKSGAVGTMKDGDLHDELYLPREERAKLLEQIEKDTEFLKSQGIMDYSLLLGVKKKLMPITSEEGDRLAKDGEATWYPNLSNAHESYHMGIIDILQKWNWSKRAERFTKAVLGKDIDGLSAIEAGTFQQRFVEAMKGHFVDKEDEEEQLFATRSTSSLALSPRESGSEGGGTPRGRLRLSSSSRTTSSGSRRSNRMLVGGEDGNGS